MSRIEIYSLSFDHCFTRSLSANPESWAKLIFIIEALALPLEARGHNPHFLAIAN